MSEKKRSIILVPHDFSEVAENAVKHAIELCRLFNNELYLLHIVESGEKDVEAEVTAKLEGIAKGLATGGLKVTALTKRGSIFETIGETADSLDTNLVVMGTHGIKGMQFITGSRAIKVITSSNAPFVVVQKKALRPAGFKNIVLPLDLTAKIKAKLYWAAYLGKKFGATFHIFVKEEKDEFLAKSVRNNLASAESLFMQEGIQYTVTHDTEGGDFADQTISFASGKDADLIVIMTNQGRVSFKFGPDDQRVIANVSQIPVMCVNPKDDNTVSGSILSV